MLEHADADQINAISEMILNLLKKQIPVDAATYGKLKRHKKCCEKWESVETQSSDEDNISSIKKGVDSGVV